MVSDEPSWLLYHPQPDGIIEASLRSPEPNISQRDAGRCIQATQASGNDLHIAAQPAWVTPDILKKNPKKVSRV